MNMIYETTKERGTKILIPSSMVDSMNPDSVLGMIAASSANKPADADPKTQSTEPRQHHRGKLATGSRSTALFYHASRNQELCSLKFRDLHERHGVKRFRIHCKGEKLRDIPVHTGALGAIAEYLGAAGHGHEPYAPLFNPVCANAPASDCKLRYSLQASTAW